jgi:heme exporter protein D
MQWHSWAEFWDMGGYALYVWGSFGITALVLIGEVWQVRSQRKAVLRNLLTDTDSQDESNSSTPS